MTLQQMRRVQRTSRANPRPGLPRHAQHNPIGLAPVESGLCTTRLRKRVGRWNGKLVEWQVVQKPFSTGASPVGL